MQEEIRPPSDLGSVKETSWIRQPPLHDQITITKAYVTGDIRQKSDLKPEDRRQKNTS